MKNDEILLRTFPKEGRRMEQIEQLVRSLPGIYSARVAEGPDGSLESIYVLISDQLPRYRITRAIHSALLIYLDVAIDEDQISVAMTHDPEAGSEPEGADTVREIPLHGRRKGVGQRAENEDRSKTRDAERPTPEFEVAGKSIFRRHGSETVETDRFGPGVSESESTGEPPSPDRIEDSTPAQASPEPKDPVTVSEPDDAEARPDPRRSSQSERTERGEPGHRRNTAESGARRATETPAEHRLQARLHLIGYTINSDRGRGVEVRVRVGRGDESFQGAVSAEGGIASISRDVFAEAAVIAAERALQRTPSSDAVGGPRFKITGVEEIEVHGQGYLAVSVSGPSSSGKRSSAVGFAAIGQDAHGAAAEGALDGTRRLFGGEPSSETPASGSAQGFDKMDPFEPWS